MKFLQEIRLFCDVFVMELHSAGADINPHAFFKGNSLNEERFIQFTTRHSVMFTQYR